jgi:hypothetical protein
MEPRDDGWDNFVGLKKPQMRFANLEKSDQELHALTEGLCEKPSTVAP